MRSFIASKFPGTRKRGLRIALVTLVATGTIGGLVAAAEGAGFARSSAPRLLVWVDATRVAQVKAYEKSHPNVKVDVVTYDGNDGGSGTLQSKFALFNRVGHGWPDVFFSGENYDAASIASPQYKDAQVLSDGLVATSVLKKFAAGTLADCTVNGKIVCLRNDIGQDVLWYNKKLMDQFGYAVPTTWAQWAAIGEQVAKQHPGYIIGSAGNAFDDEIYLQASECPMSKLLNSYTVQISPTSPNCTRVANLLDPLIANGSVPVVSLFAPTFLKQYGSKVLMMTGPSWYGDFVFANPSGLAVPAGQIAAAAPLSWTAGKQPVTGDVGGGLWFVSSHSKQTKAAVAMATWLATSYKSQGIGPTYPAYTPDQAPWVTAQQKSGYFANDLGPVFAKAGTEIWSGWSALRYAPDSIWSSTVIPALTGGSTLASQLPAFGQGLKNVAQVNGYTVKG